MYRLHDRRTEYQLGLFPECGDVPLTIFRMTGVTTLFPRMRGCTAQEKILLASSPVFSPNAGMTQPGGIPNYGDEPVMYLSKIIIKPEKMNNAYELHRVLWELFPDRPDEERPFLFRVENQSNQGAQILMQSLYQPIERSENASCLAVKAVNYDFSAGQMLRFRVRANPAVKIKDPGKGDFIRNGITQMRSSRVPLVGDNQQSWFEKKLQGNGARLIHVNVMQEQPLYFRKSNAKHAGKIISVLFEGVLEVVSPDGFHKIIANGIGPAKSFGMGLISLAV